MSLRGKNKTANKVFLLTIIFLLIELLDELVDGVYSPALPLIRNDLHLNYTQIGMLLTIPKTVSSIIEPILGIWADMGQRRQLILGGGIAFAGALEKAIQSHRNNAKSALKYLLVWQVPRLSWQYVLSILCLYSH